MQENRTIRIWQWSVILLVICNIGLLLTIWLRPHHDGWPGQSARDYVIIHLKFTDAQVKQYDLLIKDHQAAMKQLQKEAMGYRQQLFSGLKGNGQSAAFADSVARLIAASQQQTELVTYHHFEQVRKLCTDAQKTEFDNIIDEVTRKMNGPGHGGPQSPPGGPGPDNGPHNQGPPPGDQAPPPPDGQGPPPAEDQEPPPGK